MNKLSADFRKFMRKTIGKGWKFDCYTYNDHHFRDVQHLPKKDREHVEKKYPKLDTDDIVVYYHSVTSDYHPLTKSWLRAVKHV